MSCDYHIYSQQLLVNSDVQILQKSKKILDKLKNIKTVDTTLDFSIGFHIDISQDQQRLFFSIYCVNQNQLSFNSSNYITFQFSQSKLIVNVNDEAISLQNILSLKQSILYVTIIQHYSLLQFYIQGELRYSIQLKQPYLLKKIKIIESNILSLQIFQYALPLLSLKFCQMFPSFNTDYPKSPIFCYNTANLLTYKFSESDGIILPYFSTPEHCYVFSSNQNTNILKTMIQDQNYKIDKYFLSGSQYNSIQNQYLNLTESIIQQLYSYGFQAIILDKCACFIPYKNFTRVYGQLAVECLNIELPNHNKQLFIDKLIFKWPEQSSIQMENAEIIFIESWKSYNFNKLNFDYSCILAQNNSQFTYIPVCIDVQNMFTTNINNLQGLLYSNNYQQVLLLLQVVIFRYINKQTHHIFKGTFDLLDVQYMAVKFKSEAYNQENTQQVVNLIIKYLSEITDDIFFIILDTIYDFSMKYFPEVIDKFINEAFGNSFILNLSKLLSANKFDEVFDIVQTYGSKFTVVYTYLIQSLQSVLNIEQFFAQYVGIFTLIDQFIKKQDKTQQDLEINLLSIFYNNARQHESNANSYIWLVSFLVYLEQFLDDKKFELYLCCFDFANLYDHIAFIYLYRLNCLEFLDNSSLQLDILQSIEENVLLFLNINIGRVVLFFNYALQLEKLPSTYFIKFICLKKFEKYQQLFLVTFMKMMINQDNKIHLFNELSKTQLSEQVIQDYVDQYERSIDLNYSIKLPYFDNLKYFVQIVRKYHQDTILHMNIRMFFLQYYYKELIHFIFMKYKEANSEISRSQFVVITLYRFILNTSMKDILTIFIDNFEGQEFYKLNYRQLKQFVPQNQQFIQQQHQTCINYFKQQQELINFWIKRHQYQIQASISLNENEFSSSINGRLQLRQLTYQRHVYHQQLFVLPTRFSSEDFGFIQKQQLSLQHFIPPNFHILVAFNVQRLVKSLFKNQEGVLVICQEMYVFIPNVGVSGIAQDFYVNYDFTQFIKLKINQEIIMQYINIEDVPEYQSRYMIFAKNCNINCENFENSFNQTLYIPPLNIQNILQEMYCHRNIQINIVLSIGYNYSFIFTDALSQGPTDISECQITAEIQLGIFYYYYKLLFNGNQGKFMANPKIIQEIYKKRIPQNYILGLNQRVLLHPNCIQDNDFRNKLSKVLNHSPYSYTNLQQKIIMTNIEHLQIQELNRIPLYEPFRHLDHYYSLFNSISFDDISRFGEKVADSLRSDQINLSIFAILIRLSSQNLIDNFSFIYLVNRLAGRNSDNLSSNIIYPIIKNRVLDLPVQCQLAEKYNQILQKQLQIEQINPLSIIKTIKFFNMQVSLHGTFSSNPASSLYYLYRMQPYASALIDLQNGQFDAPDRMFYDYEALYKVIFWTNFKEHIPQLYTNIELYYNLHHFDLGIRSDKQKLNHVVFNNIESILQIQQQDIGEIQDTQVLQSFLIDDEQDQIVESISQTVQDNSLVQLIPVLNAEQHLDLISNREQQVENPINALQCIFELYENLEIVQKANLFRWLSLYFGPNQFSRQNFTQYSPATYLLRVQSQQLCQEFDQAKYFGAIPNKLFDCRFQQPDTKQYLLLSNKFVLKDQFLTINLITHMQKLMQGTEARKLFEPATFLPAGYQRNINFITRFTTNFLTFCNFDLVPFKTQIFDIPILQQTATAALLGLRFEGTVKLYQIKSNRIHFSHEIPLATTSICLSPSQILLVLTAYKIYAFDALNHCVLAQCDFAGGLQIQTDAWDNVYVRALACVHVFGPELARLGSIPIGEDERFVPFERMRLVVYGRNWLKMVVLSAAAADNFEVSEPSPGPYFAIPNGYEALNCEALNGCELADRIVSCGSLEVGCQQEFVFNEQIVGVEVLKFSVLVKCEVSDFSIIAD